MAARLHILYLVHDVSDPAVARRVAMLKEGGATVSIAGFRRTSPALTTLAGCPITDFGKTVNGGFVQRILSVLRVVAVLGRHRALLASADVILARNLEMLAIGARGKALCKPAPALVYESLDIHRLLLNQGIIGKTLRWLEGRLCKNASALITSSPAFIREYFEKRSRVRLPTYLIENKLFPATAATALAPRNAAAPWFIGWFGAIRCNKSLQILKELAKRSNGRVQVVIRGRPAYDQFDHFDKQVKSSPNLRFEGAYKNPDDLARIYSEVHFTWAIDMFEEGLNSSWLLPNRLYEGGAFASVPIAAAEVETGHLIQRMQLGLAITEPKLEALEQFFNALTPETYRAMEQRARDIEKDTWVASTESCRELVATLQQFAPTIFRKAA